MLKFQIYFTIRFSLQDLIFLIQLCRQFFKLLLCIFTFI